MIRTLLLAAVALVCGVGAHAQGTVQAIPGMNGYGTLAATSASAALSTLTAGPSSNAWTMPLVGGVTIYNAPASAGMLYVCPLGGTCTAAVGIPLAPGQALQQTNLGGRTTSPTVIAATTATVVAWW